MLINKFFMSNFIELFLYIIKVVFIKEITSTVLVFLILSRVFTEFQKENAQKQTNIYKWGVIITILICFTSLFLINIIKL
jgi:hypothetical protein